MASFFKSTISWMEIMVLSTYPLFLVSGYSWPVEAMPKLLQVFTNLLPATPFYDIFNMLSIQEASLADVLGQFIHLLLLLLLGILLLFVRYHLLRKGKWVLLLNSNPS